ncbi:transposase [Sphingobium sp. AP50]|nr:transposase [Sphingobium sp. AP50]
MGKPNFSDEFKRDAVAQIIERGYPVAEVSERLGVSQHSLYAWKRQLAKVVSGDASKDAEIRQLKRELARVTEERDILKNGRGLARLCAVETGRAMLRRRRVAAVRLLVA